MSVRWAMRIQSVFTAAKLLALSTIILTGVYHIGEGKCSIILLTCLNIEINRKSNCSFYAKIFTIRSNAFTCNLCITDKVG